MFLHKDHFRFSIHTSDVGIKPLYNLVLSIALHPFHLEHISNTVNLLQASSNFLARWSSEGSLWRIYRRSLNLGSGLVKIWSLTADRSLRVRIGAGIVSSSASRLISLEIMPLEKSCVASQPGSEIPSLKNARCVWNAWYSGESSFDFTLAPDRSCCTDWVGSVKPGG